MRLWGTAAPLPPPKGGTCIFYSSPSFLVCKAELSLSWPPKQQDNSYCRYGCPSLGILAPLTQKPGFWDYTVLCPHSSTKPYVGCR